MTKNNDPAAKPAKLPHRRSSRTPIKPTGAQKSENETIDGKKIPFLFLPAADWAAEEKRRGEPAKANANDTSDDQMIIDKSEDSPEKEMVNTDGTATAKKNEPTTPKEKNHKKITKNQSTQHNNCNRHCESSE